MFPRIPLPGSLASAVRKRQIEHLAGRHCAREALLDCAAHVAGVPIGTGPHREPLWPAGVIGAITHTHGFGSVAVARAADARALGLDAERWLTDDAAAQLAAQIALPAELEAIERGTETSIGRALTLASSAKESLFKCLHRDVGRYFDFHDARVVCAGPCELTLALAVSLTPTLAAGRAFTVRHAGDDRHVFTGLVLAVECR